MYYKTSLTFLRHWLDDISTIMCYHMMEPTTYLRHNVTYTGGSLAIVIQLLLNNTVCLYAVSSIDVCDLEYSEEILEAIPLEAIPDVSDDTKLWRSVSPSLPIISSYILTEQGRQH